jgi:TonB dependent receptor
LWFRDMNVPLGTPVDTTEDQDETMAGLYLYWTIYDNWALTAGLWYNEFDRAKETPDSRPTRIRTLSVPVALSYFSPLGLFATIGTTYVHQNADRFTDPPPPFGCEGPCPDGTDDFFLVDASIGYRFPGRYGIFSLEGPICWIRSSTIRTMTSEPREHALALGRSFLSEQSWHA